MNIPKKVLTLIDKFERNLPDYKNGKYGEAEVRLEYVDQLFKELGWDIYNEEGLPDSYKDVIPEFSLRTRTSVEAPDYCFRIGRDKKFFVEAKKPSINLKDNISPAFQLRRYAWSANLPVSILTDFEEFAIYDCRRKPQKTDQSSISRMAYFNYKDYPDHWDEICSMFHRDSVVEGSIDRFSQTRRRTRGTDEVDAVFLEEIEEWRELLAKNIAIRNPSLEQRDINYSVQAVIDRIIFLRISEDRGIEPYGRLKETIKNEGVFSKLNEVFQYADDRYNSGLFHFREEPNRSHSPDLITPTIIVDDKPLREIIGSLYYPDSPYEFSVLPADILGRVYEQFLGKVIRLTSSHRAKIEEKREVKKAGGVFYTPKYIVDYIVENILGKLLQNKEAGKQGDASRLRILDPACGSGTFLIGAYQYLMDWHLSQYIKDNPEKHARGRPPRLYKGESGEWKLTLEEKKRILINNIYGVDIDSQAVEVTKLSLLLKLLEGESDGSLKQLVFFAERILPDLGENIRCGNSLIDSSLLDNHQLSMTEEDELFRINMFEWEKEFPGIMSAGGFDGIIGNPPYIRIQILKEWNPVEVEFYKEHYQTANTGNYDIYVVFMERALQLLNDEGLSGFILPHKFFQAKYGRALRELLAKGQHIYEIVHFGDQQVFSGATTYTCLLFLNAEKQNEFRFIKAHDLDAWRSTGEAIEGLIDAETTKLNEWHFVVGPEADLFERLNSMPSKLGDVAHLFVGLQTDADAVYILEEDKQEGEVVFCHSKETGRIHKFENNHLKHLLKGSVNIRRYQLADLSKRIIFPYVTLDGKSKLISDAEYQTKYPLTWAYLLENKNRLKARGQGRLDPREWYGYVYKKNHTLFGNSKILVPSIASGSCFASDLKGEFYFVGSGGGGGGGYGISLNPDVDISYQYLLGILNSKLISTYLRLISTPFRGGYIALNRQYIEQIPIRLIDIKKQSDVDLHTNLMACVEQIESLLNRCSRLNTPGDKIQIERQIDAVDRKIDNIVFELYQVSDDEARIIENAS